VGFDMKKIFLLLLLTFTVATSFGQWDWNLNFEDPSYYNRVFIDTISNSNNIWQIGTPNKIIFNSAHSPTHAIVTDTMNYYPSNDTSRFIITHIRQGPFGGNESLLLDFYFKLNTDPITDYGTIEVSIDNGLTWINLLTQDTIYGFHWYEPKPVLTGNTNGWVHFSEELMTLTYLVGYSDTLLYRFTFISDGTQTNKEGWMMDDFTFHDYWEGIQEIQNDGLISLFPNPTSYDITINSTNKSNTQIIQIFKNTGLLIYNNSTFHGETIDTRQLSNGIYLLKYSDEKSFSIKKFVVNH